MAASRPAQSAAIDAQPVAPDGTGTGCAISPDGNHVAVLIAKGSRFCVVLDGVEGPRIESIIYNTIGAPIQVASYWTGNIPQIIFSDDGSHCAYLAKVGDEYVAYLDNKELARGPMSSSGMSIQVNLMFSAGGKHLFYQDGANGKYRMVVDGKVGPDSSYAMPVVTSPDGEHYAYTGFAGPLGSGVANWAVVDGRQVNYFGDSLQYTAKNVLVSRMNVSNSNTLLFNGKPAIRAARLDPTWISDDGAQIAIVVQPTPNDASYLTINGKTVDGTQGLTINNVYFSPDGKRYAALCTTKTQSKFMIVDGKKGEVYQGISPSVGANDLQLHWAWVSGNDGYALAKAQPHVPGFTADSSKFVYVASQGAQEFLVVDDNESNGFKNSFALQPTLSATGNRIAYYGVAPDGSQHIIVDDKDVTPPAVQGKRVTGLTFSPGGAHYAFVGDGTLYVDGVPQPGYLNGAPYIFSPDEKHFAYTASVANNTDLLVDGKIVDKSPGQLRYTFFSPDSQHLFWLHWANFPGTKDSLMLFADGDKVIHLTDNGVNGMNDYHWQFGSGGVVKFIGRTDNNLRRFTLTLPSNVSGMLASAATPPGK